MSVAIPEAEWCWTEHISLRRPFFKDHVARVRDTFTDPAFVVRDVDYPGRENHYRPSSLSYPFGGVLIKVVIEFQGHEGSSRPVGMVVTIYLTDRKKPGAEQMWP